MVCHRARHVVTENARPLLAVKALERANLHEIGRLTVASPASLRDDF
jgi:galactokinase